MVRLYEYRDLIQTLVMRDLKVRYRRSLIGFMWSMLQPLLTLVVLHIVFSTLFAMELRGTGIRNYPVYVLSGILFYSFFQQSIVSSMNSLRANANILQKLPVPMAVFPLSSVLSGLVNLFLSLIPLFGLILLTDHPITAELLFLPMAILIAALFTLGAGLLLAPLSIFFTDVVEMVNVFLLLMFYLTPIIYPKSIVEKHPLYWVVRYNPIRSILEIFRDPIHLNKIPPLSHISVSLAIALVALLIGSWAFHKTSDRIPFYI